MAITGVSWSLTYLEHFKILTKAIYVLSFKKSNSTIKFVAKTAVS